MSRVESSRVESRRKLRSLILNNRHRRLNNVTLQREKSLKLVIAPSCTGIEYRPRQGTSNHTTTETKALNQSEGFLSACSCYWKQKESKDSRKGSSLIGKTIVRSDDNNQYEYLSVLRRYVALVQHHCVVAATASGEKCPGYVPRRWKGWYLKRVELMYKLILFLLLLLLLLLLQFDRHFR